jgi:type II secretory pathway component PulF
MLSPALIILFGLIAILSSFNDVGDRYPLFRRFNHRLQSFLPFFGRRLRYRSIAGAAATLRALCESSVPLPEACHRVANPELSGPYSASFARLGEMLDRGDDFKGALRKCGLPDPFVTLAIGGALGGALPNALAAAAEWYQSRAERLDGILLAVLPCVTIPLAGLMVGLVYGSVFWRINQIRELLLDQLRIMHGW